MRGREELSLVGRKTDHLLPASKITSKMRKYEGGNIYLPQIVFPLTVLPLPAPSSLPACIRLKPKVGEIQTISPVDNDLTDWRALPMHRSLNLCFIPQQSGFQNNKIKLTHDFLVDFSLKWPEKVEFSISVIIENCAWGKSGKNSKYKNYLMKCIQKG